MPKDLENDTTYGEREDVHAPTRLDPLKQGSSVLYSNFHHFLFHELRLALWPAGGWHRSVSDPHHMTAARLLSQAEGAVFRVWYQTMGRMQMVAHERSLNGPKGDRSLKWWPHRLFHLPCYHRPKYWLKSAFNTKAKPPVVTIRAEHLNNQAQCRGAVEDVEPGWVESLHHSRDVSRRRQEFHYPLWKHVLIRQPCTVIPAKYARISHEESTFRDDADNPGQASDCEANR